MSYVLDGQLVFDIKIDNKPFYANPSDIESIVCNENALMALPSCRLRLLDRSGGSFNKLAVTDGTKIEIRIGATNDDKQSHTVAYRVVGQPTQTPIQDGQRIDIYAVYDCYPFLRSLAYGAYEGTSSDVIAQIAEKCGLSFNGDGTNDKMIWRPSNEAFCHFAKSVSEHGWINDVSAMAMGVDDKGVVHYKNLVEIPNNIKRPLPIYTYRFRPGASNIRESLRTLVSFNKSTQSGFTNLFYNYGFELKQDKMDGTSEYHTKVDITKNLTPLLDINKDLYNQLDYVRQEYVPPDTGNTHPKYIRAVYQNKRLRALFSAQTTVISQTYATDDLFDIISVEAYSQAIQGPDTTVSMNYMLMAKSRVIRGTEYYEKLGLVSMGRDETPNKDLL